MGSDSIYLEICLAVYHLPGEFLEVLIIPWSAEMSKHINSDLKSWDTGRSSFTDGIWGYNLAAIV